MDPDKSNEVQKTTSNVKISQDNFNALTEMEIKNISMNCVDAKCTLQINGSNNYDITDYDVPAFGQLTSITKNSDSITATDNNSTIVITPSTSGGKRRRRGSKKGSKKGGSGSGSGSGSKSLFGGKKSKKRGGAPMAKGGRKSRKGSKH